MLSIWRYIYLYLALYNITIALTVGPGNVIIVLWKIQPPLEILSLQDKWGEHVDLVIIYFYQTIRINFPLQPLQRECSMSEPRALIDIFTSLERERGE